MKILACTLLELSYKFIMKLLINIDKDIRILSRQGFSEKNIISFLSDQLRQLFDDLYWAHILGRYKLGFFHCGRDRLNSAGHSLDS